MATTSPHNFTVPEDPAGTPQPGIYIQAVGDESPASPGAWGYVRIWQDPVGIWHDEFVTPGWEIDIVSQKQRLRRSYDAAITVNAPAGLPVFGNADPIGIRLHPSVLRWRNLDVFDELLAILNALEPDATDFPKSSSPGMLGEKLVWVLEGGNPANYDFQTTPGYDFAFPASTLPGRSHIYHEVKSFMGSSTIRFTSEQLQFMGDSASYPYYFVWLVKKTGAYLGNWEIYKLKGLDLFGAIKHLAKGRFHLADNGELADVHLSVGVKFVLPGGTPSGSAICLKGPAEENGTPPLNVPIQGVVGPDEEGNETTFHPRTVAEWYEKQEIEPWWPAQIP